MNNENSVSINREDLYKLFEDYLSQQLLTRTGSKIEKMLIESMDLNKDCSISLKCQTAETFNNGVKARGEKIISIPAKVVILILIIKNLNLGYDKESKYNNLIDIEEILKNLNVISPGNLKSWPPEEEAISFKYLLAL